MFFYDAKSVILASPLLIFCSSAGAMLAPVFERLFTPQNLTNC